jgi:RimJ/RimL family protein N-acetyltransferase
MTDKRNTSYKLRKVEERDIELLFEWANDEDVRINSINTGKIFFNEHKEWFKKKSGSSHCVMFMLETGSEPAGQIRFDFDTAEQVWKIDYSVSKKYRGKGLSKILLREAMHTHNQFPVVGYVKENNRRSNAVFSSLGFINKGLHRIENIKLIKYIKDVG